MCMICAAIRAAAAAGTKLNADQASKEESRRLPIPNVTAVVIGDFMITSRIYHTRHWQS